MYGLPSCFLAFRGTHGSHVSGQIVLGTALGREQPTHGLVHTEPRHVARNLGRVRAGGQLRLCQDNTQGLMGTSQDCLRLDGTQSRLPEARWGPVKIA